jgi:chromosome segregation ATPase
MGFLSKILPQTPEGRRRLTTGVLGGGFLLCAVGLVFVLTASSGKEKELTNKLRKLENDVKDKEKVLDLCLKQQGAEGFNLVTEMAGQNRMLDSSLKSQTAKLTDLTYRFNELTNRHAELDRRHAELQERDSILQSNHGILQRTHAELQNNLSKLQEQLAAVQKSREDLQNNYYALQKSRDDIQSQLGAALRNNQELVQNNNALQRSKDEYVRAAEARERDLQAEVNKLHKINLDWQQKHDKLEQQIRALKSEK